MNFTSPHTHPESHLTGSTVTDLIDKAKRIGRTHFAYTDNGHLSSVLKAYNIAKKKDLKFITGLEFYFKDVACPYINGTPAEKCKYFTATIYCRDQEAYQELCKLSSRTDMPTIEIYEEGQQLWSWKDLEHMSQFNIDLVTSGPHCMVGKTMLAGATEASEKIALRLKQLFGDNTYLALLAEPWAKKWQNVIEIKYVDGTSDSILAGDMVATDAAKRMKAIDLIGKKHHRILKAKTVNNTYYEVDKLISSVNLHKGFLPLPGGDVTLTINKFFMDLSNKYGFNLLVTDYAYYADKEDKIVQTMRLEGVSKLHPNLHMKDGSEIKDYLVNILKISETDAEQLIAKNNVWAKKFDDFKLKYELQLVNCDEDPSKKAMDVIRKNGRMKWDDPIWVDRLKEELIVIAKNPIKNLLPYFFPIIEINEFCNKNNILTGVARGSAGGSLLCYLMGVTNLNPMKYDLSFSRFLSLDRIKNGDFPDVDCLSSDTMIKTDSGDVSIEYLSKLPICDYPKIASFDGNIDVWEVPTIIFKKGIKQIHEYTLDNGSTIKCTEDHKVLTDIGWIEINEAFKRGMDIKSIK